MFPSTHASSKPGAIATVEQASGRARTYEDLDARSNQIAHQLRRCGVRRGDTVLLVLDNRLATPDAIWGAMRCGAFVAPANTRLTAHELSVLVGSTQPAAVITVDRFAAAVGSATASAGSNVPIITLDTVSDRALAYSTGELIELPAALEELPTAPLGDQSPGARQLFSSGTTGTPKSFRRPLPDPDSPVNPFSLGLLGERLGVEHPGVVYLSTGPIYHAAPFTFVLAVQSAGGTVVMTEKFDEAGCLEAIERHRVTHSQWVPTMFVRMLRLGDGERPEPDLSSHRVAIHAGAPCAPGVKRQMIDWWGPILHEYYGASEGYGQTYIGPQEWLAHPGSVGTPLSGTIEIRNEDGRILPPGEVGRVFFVRDAKGRTVDDLGHLDDAGYLYLHGRDSNTIISGGVNVSPHEVEDALLADPRVADALVVGVPDDLLGQCVAAVIELSDPQHSDSVEDVIAGCRTRLAGFKIPRLVHVVDRVPRLGTGKPDLCAARRVCEESR